MYFFLRADSSFSASLMKGYYFGAEGLLVFHSKIIELLMKLLSKLIVFLWFRVLVLVGVWREASCRFIGLCFSLDSFVG